MGEVVSMTVDGINAAIAAALSGAGLSEAEVQALIDAGLASLVDTAPGTLDTLNELAAALGDDENFASNIITSISGVKSGSVGVVIHGSDPNVVRPTGYGVIHWIGSVDPVNATNNDYWTDPDEVNGTLPTAVKLAFLNSGTVLNLNSVVWASATLSGLELVVPASVGDVLEASISAIVQNDATPELFLDVATMNGSTIINRFGNGTDGVQGWRCRPSVWATPSGSIHYVVQAGDLVVPGEVTIRPVYKTSSAANRVIFTAADASVQFSVKNIGPLTV